METETSMNLSPRPCQSIMSVSVRVCFLCLFILGACAPKPPYRQPELTTRADGLPSAGQYRGLSIDDMDNDGRLDIVGCASSPGAVAVWYGAGDGIMEGPEFLPIKGDVRSVATSDIDGDGLKDIVFSVRRESSGVMVWRNRSQGKMNRHWERGVSPVEGNLYERVLTADVNNDGHLDILAANATTDTQAGIQIWLGDGRGNWTAETGPTTQGRYMDIALADFDEDGRQDLVGAGWGTYGGLQVWLGDGRGNWSAVPTVDKGDFYGLTATDMDGDDHMDILAGRHRGGVGIYAGDGTGRFRRMTPPVTQGSFWKVRPADLDGDGEREILAGSVDGTGIRVWRRGTDVPWIAMTDVFPADGIYYDIEIADINGDGQNDVCAASFGAGIKLWLGRGGAAPLKVREVAAVGEQVDRTAVSENDVFTEASGFPEYKIGPGDVLTVTMWKGSTAEEEEILVRPDGTMSFAFVEDLEVKGLTATQLDKLLTEDLKQFIREPRLDVVVKEHRSKYVTFAGEIYTNVTFRSGPGRYPLTGKITLLEMLSKAGGPTQRANLRDVRVRRANGRNFSVDLYKTINFGDRTQNPIVDAGDLVVIPAVTKEDNRVYVFGEVIKPGVFTFSGSEMRLFDAISQAGGVTIFAKAESTKIVRGDITRPEVISADLERLIETGDQGQNVGLVNGDLVYVPRSFVGNANRFVKQISPLLRLIFIPASFRNEYMRGDAVRLP